ncbi:TonB-dependent receptor plug domain-containing protein [Allosphingosinicella deserti]|uniref:TonB-dependent receptor n=1 Tax=Allosphingosinicella deserti TaxID=2116704 RepID=A0A2P7QYP3_9SPHN|nr:TonB-dependent receptor [Sphingomonas deserti]PSJ43077.1 TonB-dependent receptor [Sphingomonas deserti]
MSKILQRTLFASTSLACLLLAAGPVAAQVAEPAEASPDVPAPEEQAAQGGEIVVTGSRIARPDLQISSPVTVVGQEEIQLRQAPTAEALLRDLPSVRPSIGPAVNNGGDGSATINLRGIGENRSLVLLDGRRIVPFGLDNLTDLNTIPVALVERVDVPTGGASSVYGADAVAGVVNFITRRNFSGVDLSSSYRISERGDSALFRADLVIGSDLADGRGNAVLALGYTKSDPLLTTDRNIGEFPILSANGQFSGSLASVPTIFTSPNAAALGVANTGFGAAFDPSTGRLRAGQQGDTFNSNIGTYFQTPLERYNVYAAAHYEVTPGIEVYSSGMFTRNDVRIQLASSATFTNTYQLSLNNPYLPAAARNQLCAAFDTNPAVTGIQPISAANCAAAGAAVGGPGTPGYIEIPVIAQRRFTEYGPRGNAVESTMFQVQAGLRGDITENIRFDISGQHGETTQNQTRENWGSFSRVQQALRAYRNGAGTPVCTDASNGCVPLNLFGPEGSITPEMIAFFDLDALIRRTTKLTVVTGSVSGDLFSLQSPFAETPLGFALGAEYRKVSARSNPDAPSQIQGEVLGTGARTPPDFGTISVKEVFGELLVPLVEKSFIYNASIEAGIRYSDYSTTGGSTTWKAGGSISPVRDIKFRGMYQRAVRSPNIQELFQSPVQGLGNLAVDPCAGANPSASRVLCEGTGAPPGTYGSISTPSSSQINVTTAGNPNLDVEKARTYTLGAVFMPGFLPNLAVTLDYFNIVVKDAITQPAQGDILNGCYSSTLNPSQTLNDFCALIGRNPLNGSLNGAGDTPGVILGYSNLGQIETAGVDLGITYRLKLSEMFDGDPGELRFGFNGTWLDYYHFQANELSINRDCTGFYSTNCTNPRAEWKWNGRVTYSTKAVDVSLLWNHVSSVKLEPFTTAAIQPLDTPQPGGPNPTTVFEPFRKIKAYDYFDLTFRARPAENLDITITIENLLDKAPPLVGANVGGTSYNSGNTFPTIYDPIGRAFTVGAHLTF